MNQPDQILGRELVQDALDELQMEIGSGAVWENNTLERFLESFSALLGSIENSYANAGKDVPADPWAIVADVFRGARHYE